MPPALQMLQDLLGGDSSSDDEEVENKPESGEPLMQLVRGPTGNILFFVLE